MKKTGIFYGSTTGTTESLAKQIATLLDVADADIYDVANAEVASVNAYEVLILGSPTWGLGELQDDWYSFLDKLKKVNLNGKTVALFGCGDSSSYDTTFCDAIGIIYEELQNSGCTFCGDVDTEGYSFSDSKAVVNDRFVGLALDEINESDRTEERLNHWIQQLKQNCLQ